MPASIGVRRPRRQTPSKSSGLAGPPSAPAAGTRNARPAKGAGAHRCYLLVAAGVAVFTARQVVTAGLCRMRRCPEGEQQDER